MKSYNDFNSVEELYEFYHIQKPMINEKKEEKEEKDSTEPTKVLNPDKLEVVYADLKKPITNIFKHLYKNHYMFHF